MKKMNYDTAVKRLEEIVQLLEDENTPIETSLTLFKEGIELTAFCQKKLSDIEKEITVLQAPAKEESNHDA